MIVNFAEIHVISYITGPAIAKKISLSVTCPLYFLLACASKKTDYRLILSQFEAGISVWFCEFLIGKNR